MKTHIILLFGTTETGAFTKFASCFAGCEPTSDIMESGQWDESHIAFNVGEKLKSSGKCEGYRVVEIDRLG